MSLSTSRISQEVLDLLHEERSSAPSESTAHSGSISTRSPLVLSPANVASIVNVPSSVGLAASGSFPDGETSASATAQSPAPLKPSQSVSFGDLDSQERSRRFTISAQPSVVNVTTQVPSRKTSMTTSSRKNSTNDVLLFLTTHLHGSNQHPMTSVSSANGAPVSVHGNTSSNNSSRVNSPTTVDPSSSALKLSFSFESGKENDSFRQKSPSPPPYARTLGPSGLASPASTTLNSQTQPIKITNSGNNSANVSRKGSMKKSNKTVVASPVGPPVPFQQYLSKEYDGKFHILLACTGSVATIKVPLIIDKLFQTFGASKISIQLVVTKSSVHFLRGLKIHNDVKIWRDEDEWVNYGEGTLNTTTASTSEANPANKKPKSPYDKLILHNELRRWADIMLIAPLSANTLAKIANGIADNLLTSIVRSWGPSTSGQIKKPILVAPAMNTFMYTHPITAKQLALIASPDYGIEVLKPVEKVLVCGDIGMGGMREWSELVDLLRRKASIIRAERKTRDEKLLAEEDEDGDEDEDEDEEDDEDEDDDDDDEVDEKYKDNTEREKTGKVTEESKKQDTDKFDDTNDNDEMIFEITDQEGEVNVNEELGLSLIHI